jgi:hypothetical protein
MVTATADHGPTDLENELIMPFPIFRPVFFAIALGMAAPLFAQQPGTTVGGDAGRKPLNLSLPREAAFPLGTATRQDNAADKATPDRTRSEPDGTAAPYGAGFEARRRGLGGRGFGGGGRGMGRGR